MAVLTHHPRRDGDPSTPMALLRAVLTIVLVTIVVASALGGVTYLASNAFVGLLPG